MPQLLVALVLFGFAYSTGKTDMHLLQKGARTDGRIVGFQKRQFRTNRNRISTGTPGRNVYLPIVEFEADGTLARFEEHKLLPSGEGVGWVVPVLYDPANPSVAMIDPRQLELVPLGPGPRHLRAPPLQRNKRSLPLLVSTRTRTRAHSRYPNRKRLASS